MVKTSTQCKIVVMIIVFQNVILSSSGKPAASVFRVEEQQVPPKH
jgi:hypothetical protein